MKAKPYNYKQVGYIRRMTDNYCLIKRLNEVWRPLHRYLVEKYIGRKLKHNEIIHHIDGNGLNNKLRNLYIFKSVAGHRHFESLIRYKEIDRFVLKSNLKEFKYA